MLNETLCNEDNLKQAHLAQVDFYIKRLLGFNRLSVDVFEKLMALRDEEANNENSSSTRVSDHLKTKQADN